MGWLKLWWKPLCALVVVGLIWWGIHHYGATRYEAGRQTVLAEDAKAGAAKKIENAQKEAADAKRTADAYRARDASEAELAAIRARPRTSVVCHRAPSRPERMPEAARLSDAEAAGAGALSRQDPAGPEPDFDPSAELYDTGDEADSIVADCRMLHQAVHGFPSTLPARRP